MVLKLGIQGLKIYLEPICEYKLRTLPNTKASAAKDHDENCMKVRPPLVHRLLRVIVYNALFAQDISRLGHGICSMTL